MKTINTLAWANTKHHKGKNILSGIAVFLTTILVFLIISVGIGSINAQNYIVNQTYPTWHGMYRNISEKSAREIPQHEEVDLYGLRQDIGEAHFDNSRILISYLDDNAQTLNKLELTEGRAPEKGNEAVLSLGALKLLGYEQPQLGDTFSIPYQPYEAEGIGLEETADFKLVGVLPDAEEAAEDRLFSMMVTKDFMEQVIPEADRAYRVMIRLAGAENMTTDEIEAQIKSIGESFDVLPEDVVENSSYLQANYVDPAFYTGMAGIILVILFAGALTIYSIYYVSLINKVQEFGKLKALGATKKQIRQTILRENLIVAGIAIPAGLLAGIATVRLFFQTLLQSVFQVSASADLMKKAIDSGEVRLIIPWVLALTVAAVFLTVVLSSMKPMGKASRIMPIEAMRYTGQAEKGKKKQRKGYMSLSPAKLANANLSRNKKRTLLTVCSLGLLGTLFVVAATIFTCMKPEQVAKDEIAHDFRISIESWSNDKMNPDREWTAIQQDNPLAEDLLGQIKEISGVKKVTPHYEISGEIPAIMEGDKPLSISLKGLNEDQIDDLKPYIEEGKVSYDVLVKGDAFIASGYFTANFPEVKVGDKVALAFKDGDKTFEKEMTLIAKGDFPERLDAGATFMSTNETVQGMSDNNLTSTADIQVSQGAKAEVEEVLTNIENSSKYLKLDTYDKILAEWQSTTQLFASVGYGILIILAIVGVMNLINTTIDSILTRKKELGVMQAIGMSNRQMNHMLQSEGLVYVLGILLLSIGLGSFAGYMVYSYASDNGLLQIRTFHYPVVQVLLLLAVTVIIQLTLTIVTTRMIHRTSIIERIHVSE